MPAGDSLGAGGSQAGHPPARVGAVALLRRNRLGAVAYKAYRHSAMVLHQRLEGTSAAGVLLRVWGWQLWRRLVGRPVMIRCAEGSRLIAPRWSSVAAVIVATGLTERDDAVFVLDLMRDGDLFVDVGANIGFYTAIAAGRGARVEAYEPTPQASDVCERVVELNGLQRLARVHRVACGAESGTVRFTTGLDIRNHIAGAGEAGVEVELRTLDEELAGADPPMCMLKVDAEGHDLDVLRGALETIARLRPVILVEIWTGGTGPLRVVEGHGYRPYAYDRLARTLHEIAPDHRAGGNALLVSDANLEQVRERLRTAQRPQLRAPAVRRVPR